MGPISFQRLEGISKPIRRSGICRNSDVSEALQLPLSGLENGPKKGTGWTGNRCRSSVNPPVIQYSQTPLLSASGTSTRAGSDARPRCSGVSDLRAFTVVLPPETTHAPNGGYRGKAVDYQHSVHECFLDSAARMRNDVREIVPHALAPVGFGWGTTGALFKGDSEPEVTPAVRAKLG